MNFLGSLENRVRQLDVLRIYCILQTDLNYFQLAGYD